MKDQNSKSAMARKKGLKIFTLCIHHLSLQGVHLILEVGGANEYKIFGKVANFLLIEKVPPFHVLPN